MQKGRTLNSVKNIYIGLFNQVILLVITFLSRTVFINLFGPEYLGINGLYGNILSILALAELGLGNVMTFSLYQPLYEKNEHKIIAYLNFYKKCYRLIALVISILGLCIVPFLKYIINSSGNIFLDEESVAGNSSYLTKLVTFYLIFLLDSVCSYFVIYKSTLIIADQKNHIISTFRLRYSIVIKITQILMMFLTRQYELYLLTQVVFTLLCNYHISRKADSLYPYIVRPVGQTGVVESLSKEEKREIVGKVKSMSLFKLGWALMNGTDNILISVLVGTVYVGYYSNYYIFISAINSLVAVLTHGIVAGIGNLNVEGDRQKVGRVFFQLVYYFHVATAIVFICFCIVFNQVMQLWLGEDYLISHISVICIAINFYIQNIINPVWMFREATGLYEEIKYTMLIASVINIGLSLVLGKLIGIGGIILATGVARLFTVCWYEPMVLFSKKMSSPLMLYFKRQIKYILITGISLAISVFLCRYFKELTVINIFIKLLLCGSATILSFIIFTYRDWEYQDSKKFVLNFLKEKIRGI